MKRFSLRFGCLVPSIYQQLADQGVFLASTKLDACQRFADAISLLAVQGILTQTEVGRAEKRLLKKICEVVKEGLSASND